MCCSDDDKCQAQFCLCDKSCDKCQSCWPCNRMHQNQMRHPEIVDQAHRKIAKRYADNKCKFGLKVGFRLKLELKFQMKTETYMSMGMKTGTDMPGQQYICCSNCHCPVTSPEQCPVSIPEQCPVNMSGVPSLIPTAPALPEWVPT